MYGKEIDCFFSSGCGIILTKKEQAMQDFIKNLDEYFSEKYADYDKLCALQGYKMPVMQATKKNEFGKEVGYTLPKTELRLALQENKAELLAQLKDKLVDKTFSFSFIPHKWHERIKNMFTPYTFAKSFQSILHKRNLSTQDAKQGLAIDDEVYAGILKGKFMPTKNLIFSIGLAMGLTQEEFDAKKRQLLGL